MGLHISLDFKALVSNLQYSTWMENALRTFLHEVAIHLHRHFRIHVDHVQIAWQIDRVSSFAREQEVSSTAGNYRQVDGLGRTFSQVVRSYRALPARRCQGTNDAYASIFAFQKEKTEPGRAGRATSPVQFQCIGLFFFGPLLPSQRPLL